MKPICKRQKMCSFRRDAQPGRLQPGRLQPLSRKVDAQVGRLYRGESNIRRLAATLFLALGFSACKLPQVATNVRHNAVPDRYISGNSDTANSAFRKPSAYFTDPNLIALIDTAVQANQELAIAFTETLVSRAEAQIRQGEYLPSVRAQAGAGLEKTPRYTRLGALEKSVEIDPGKENPEPLPDLQIGLVANWEVDIWHKLRNARKSALTRYLGSIEGRNFAITNIVAEVANSYYELQALDNQLAITEQNISILTNALDIVRLQKEAGRVTELAVQKFEAEVLKTQSLQYGLRQQITETENRINFLLGRFPQPIARSPLSLDSNLPAAIATGIPAQLLANRPDVRRAELEVAASNLDAKVAKAFFYPSLDIRAALGFQAFNPKFLLSAPESVLANLAGDLTAPLVNRLAIKAAYVSANARQVAAAYGYERTVLNAYVEVANQQAKMGNLQSSYGFKNRQVAALNRSISLATDLFRYGRADYMEVLLTQRDALEAKLELVETRRNQLAAVVDIYRALGGGWR